MTDLLTPEQIDGIKERCGFMVTCGFADDSEKDVVALLRDREAIAERLEQIEGEQCLNCPDQGWFAEQIAEDDWEQCQCEFCYTVPWSRFNVRALVTAIRGEK